MLKLRRTSTAVHVRRRDLFSYRDFRYAISGQYLSQTSDALTTFVLAEVMVFSFSQGPSLSAMTYALLVSAIPLLLIGPIAGHIADRYNRKLILCVGHLFRAVITLTAIAATFHRFHFYGYIVFALLMGLTRLLYTTRATLFPMLVRKHELVAADSTSLIVGVIAGSTGGGIGILLTRHSPAALLVLACLGQLAAFALYRSLRTNLGTTVHRFSRNQLRHLINLVRMPKTKYAMFATASHRALLGICIASTALLVDSEYGLKTTGYVAVLGFSACGAFLGSVSSEWASEHFPRRSITIVVFALSSLVSLVVSFISVPQLALVAVGVTAFLFQNLRIRSDATIQSNVESTKVGHVFAAYDMLYNLSFISGCAVGISLTGITQYSAVLVLASVGFGVMTCVFAYMNDGKSEPIPTSDSHPSTWQVLANTPATAA